MGIYKTFLIIKRWGRRDSHQALRELKSKAFGSPKPFEVLIEKVKEGILALLEILRATYNQSEA
jgi:hypothetical protein